MFLVSGFLQAVILLVIWVPLVLFWVAALADLFVRRDISGIHRVVWLLVIILLPILGTLIYFLVRSRGELPLVMPTQAAPVSAVGDQLDVLTRLRDAGSLTEEEFAKAKAKLLG